MLETLETPALLLDRRRMVRNAGRMAAHVARLGARLRPHVKTHKSSQVLAAVQAAGPTAGITVSTLSEAEYFLAAGEQDIFYAVSMAASKMPAAARLVRAGCRLSITTDNLDAAHQLDAAAAAERVVLPVLIELDVDGHRSGVDPHSALLPALAAAIAEAGALELAGVMTHAGGAYDLASPALIADHARLERALPLMAAERIRALGLPCPVVSIGSTPTAIMADNLDGITEIRPGVYTFFDLFQAGLGVATAADIALSVLTTVIGHRPDKGWVIVDAGWMAMSRDRGTASQRIDQGYGLVCDMAGVPIGDVIMGQANQEHGILMQRPGADDAPLLDVGAFPIGSRWRILPNHACATAAQHLAYHVFEDGGSLETWPRCKGW